MQEIIDIKNVDITHKGVALVAWLNCDLAPKVKGGKDISTFEKFWAEYEKLCEEYLVCKGDNQ